MMNFRKFSFDEFLWNIVFNVLTVTFRFCNGKSGNISLYFVMFTILIKIFTSINIHPTFFVSIVNVKYYIRLCNIENLKNVEAKKFFFKRNKFVQKGMILLQKIIKVIILNFYLYRKRHTDFKEKNKSFLK